MWRIWPAASNSIARVLVVPWSIASRQSGALVIAPPLLARRSEPALLPFTARIPEHTGEATAGGRSERQTGRGGVAAARGAEGAGDRRQFRDRPGDRAGARRGGRRCRRQFRDAARRGR